LFSLSVLPVTAVGIALLVLAAALFIGEIFVPGVGVLAAGGSIWLILAGLFLFEGAPSVRPPILWPTALVVGGATTWAGRLAWRSRRELGRASCRDRGWLAVVGVGSVRLARVSTDGDST